MKLKHKRILKANLFSLFLIALSFTSITMAWFAYSGLGKLSTDIDVKAWYIEFDKNGENASNDITISLNDIAPGMDAVNEKINIKNLGDSDAQISYEIKSIRILDQVINIDGMSIEEIEDKLAHDFPFHININLTHKFAVARNGISDFIVSVTWPFNSLNDELDTEWGNKAFNFRKEEQAKLDADPDYIMRQPIKLELSLKAEQYLNEAAVNEMQYDLGNIVLYDPINNQKCDSIGSTCLKTYVIDTNNKVSDDKVTLLPDIYNDYGTNSFNDLQTSYNSAFGNWQVSHRPLEASDVLRIISTDVVDSYLVRETLSDVIIGYLGYQDRVASVLEKAKSYNGYFKFNNDLFKFLDASGCYWLNTEYDVSKGFNLSNLDDKYSVIKGEDKSKVCNIVPVIEVSKNKLK